MHQAGRYYVNQEYLGTDKTSSVWSFIDTARNFFEVFSMLNTKIKCTERNGANTFLTSFSCLPSPNRDFWRGYCPLPMISYLPSLPGKPRFFYLRGWLSAIWKNYRPFLIIGHESLFSGLIMGPGSRGSNLQVGWTKGVSARPENTFRGLRLSGWKK